MIKRPLVIFDMDGVLVTNRSSWRVVHEVVGIFNENSFQAYIRGDIDDDEFMERDIHLWKEKGIVDRSQLLEALDKVETVKGLEQCINELKEGGCVIGILSGGLDLLAERIGREYGITLVKANGVEFDEQGKTTGKGILRVPLRDKGSVLRAIVQEGETYSPVIAVGDSPVDITMFEVADLSIAFDPESDIVKENADKVVEKPDLTIVSRIIMDWLKEGM